MKYYITKRGQKKHGEFMMTGVDVPCVLQVQYECLRVEHVPFLIWTLSGTSQQIGATRRIIGIAANPLRNCRVVHV